MSVMRVTLRPALMQTGYCREIALHSQPRRKLPWGGSRGRSWCNRLWLMS